MPLKVVSLTKQYWDLVVSTAVQQIRARLAKVEWGDVVEGNQPIDDGYPWGQTPQALVPGEHLGTPTHTHSFNGIG